MAYVSQEKKALVVEALKAAGLNKRFKYSIRVRHHSTLVLTIKSGDVDFAADYIDKFDRPLKAGEVPGVNPYWYKEHFKGASLEALEKFFAALNLRGVAGEENFDKSDIQSDYFHVGWYVDIELAPYGKAPYQYVPAKQAA
jgi:hypothetical protein